MALSVIEKWGRPVAERGFAQIPNYLLLLNQFLDIDQRLSPVELLVLIQLVAAWWRKEEMPFPSMRTLGLRCGVSERQIQRTVGRLQQLGLIERVRRGHGPLMASNAYNLQPLVEVLRTVSTQFPNARPRNLVPKPDAQVQLKVSSKSGKSAPKPGVGVQIIRDRGGELAAGRAKPPAPKSRKSVRGE
jgi:hypothetical protein